jgi:SAM-dependent methyltransferase
MRRGSLRLPFSGLADETFELAVMALVIHHLDDRIATLREILRVLRPEGMLVLSTHHPTGDWLTHGGSSFDVSLIEETRKRGWDVRYWRLPLSELVAEFAAAGFQIDRLVEPRPNRAWPSASLTSTRC